MAAKAGPNVKPRPKAALKIPKLPARFSGGVTSAMYALAVEKLAEVIPEMMRPTKSQLTPGASAITM